MGGLTRIAVITPTVVGREGMLARVVDEVAALDVPDGLDVHHACWVDHDREGPAKTRNLMAANTTGDWLLLLDDDDEIDRDYLRVLAPYLDEHDVVAGFYRTAGTPPIPGWTSNRLFRNEAMLRGPNFLPVTALVRRSAWDAVGGMRHVALEDQDLWIRLVKEGARFVTVPEVVWTFHFHQGQFFSKGDA